MTYIIAGVPRAGKSILAKRLAKYLGVSNINFDDITLLFENAVPDYGLKMIMDQETREKLCLPLVETLIKTYFLRKECLIIDGDHFRVYDFDKYKKMTNGNVKMVFLGYSNLQIEEKININQHTSNIETDWFNQIEDYNQKQKTASEFIERSKKIEKEVVETNDEEIRYYNTHDFFDTTLETAFNFLIS